MDLSGQGIDRLVSDRRDLAFAVLVASQQENILPHTKTRCPATAGVRCKPCSSEELALQYAAAISILLFDAKLEDDIKDTGSETKKAFQILINAKVHRAKSVLQTMQFPVDRLIELKEEQRLMEESSAPTTFEEVTHPSARAVSLVLVHTAKLGNIIENTIPLEAIGGSLGRLITVLDACEDYSDDERQHAFNAVAAVIGSISSNQLSGRQYHYVENFVLAELRLLRTNVRRLVLRRHEQIIVSVLYTGIFDAARDACERLKELVTNESTHELKPIVCSRCGEVFDSHFCSNCGRQRPMTLQ